MENKYGKDLLLIPPLVMALYVTVCIVTDKVTKEDVSPNDNCSISYSGDTLLYVDTLWQGLFSVDEHTKVIGKKAFNNCKKISIIKMPSTVKVIEDMAFAGCSVAKIELQHLTQLQSIGDFAFAWCNKLNQITLPSSLTKIGLNPFAGINHHINVRIKKGCKYKIISNYLIKDSEIISYIGNDNECSIPKEVKIIGKMAFWGKASLRIINMPESVTMIGDKAFIGCINLHSIYLPKSLDSIGINPFLEDRNIERIIFPNHNNKFRVEEKCLINTESSILISYYGNDAYVDLDILTGLDKDISTIGKDAFYNCSFLDSIAIPMSLCRIDDYAFKGCKKLNNVILKNNSINNIKIGIGNEVITQSYKEL